MTKLYKKEQALQMRKRGMSITEISTTLSVSKSTVSVWCRDVSLSEKAISNIARKGNKNATEALMRYSEKKRKARQQAEAASKSVGSIKLGTLSNRDIYCIGLGLYWGEGYKTGNQEFGFTNSDPRMIAFYVRWLKTVFGIKETDLILRVSINHIHKHRTELVEAYWATLLSISSTQFTKTSLIKSVSKKLYKNQSEHMGTLRIKVRRGTVYRREVLGAIGSIY